MTQAVFDVPSLAQHWGCGTDTIYALVRSGELQHFKLGGKLIRIRADAVEKYECRNNTQSSGSETVSPSSGGKTVNADDIRLERLIQRQPRQRRGASGAGATSGR